MSHTKLDETFQCKWASWGSTCSTCSTRTLGVALWLMVVMTLVIIRQIRIRIRFKFRMWVWIWICIRLYANGARREEEEQRGREMREEWRFKAQRSDLNGRRSEEERESNKEPLVGPSADRSSSAWSWMILSLSLRAHSGWERGWKWESGSG